MNTLLYYIPFIFTCLFSLFICEGSAFASTSDFGVVIEKEVDVLESFGDAQVETQVAEENPNGFSVTNLWALTEKAGPLRWPIFGVFLIGMFLVFFKLYELLADKRESREIEDMDFRLMNVPQLIRAISGQRESMVSRLHAVMLNVFQSNFGHSDLHEEIANYIRFQQDKFDTFKRRIDFLSDTAGALGLLGTVWGIFAVFSQGLLDDQVILTGMGLALISTLLGLVVSIILNFSSTEIFSLFNKRLDRVTEKSDELRFRLMELASGPEEFGPEPFIPDYTPPQPYVQEDHLPALQEPAADDDTQPKNNINLAGQLQAKPIAEVEAVFEDRFSNNSSYGDSTATTIRKPLVESSVEYPVEPHNLSFVTTISDTTVGKKIRDLSLLLVDQEGEPVQDREVILKVEEGGSIINEKESTITEKTDEEGQVLFELLVAKKVGQQVLMAYVPGSEAPSTKCKHMFLAKAGVPRKLKQFGNNQGGAAGEILSKPLKVQVLDEFENPIPEWLVTFNVDLGGGVFENNKTEIKVKTNANGEGIALFRVGVEPGFNTVRAAVEGVVKELKFQAMSMA